jgi:S-DNA-T family DNA segregation ATPase FtsK/SpoIIIE
MQRLLREARALLVGFAALLLAAILLTHNVADPGFSTTGDSAAIDNLGGKSGAWLSDLLLMLFGLSAWWWVILAWPMSFTPSAISTKPRWRADGNAG